MIDRNLLKELLDAGKTARQIARERGWSRTEVEIMAAQLKSEELKARFRVSGIILAVLLVLAGGAYAVRMFTKEPVLEMHQNVLRAADGLKVSAAAKSWAMEEEARGGEALPVKVLDFTTKMREVLNRTLADNSDISEIKEVAQKFGGHLYPTVFLAAVGTSMMTGTNEKELDSPFRDPQALEVVFYSHQAFRHPRIKGRLLFYDAEWRSLFMAALNWTDQKWFAAAFAHELWHAYMHRTGSLGATAPPLSDPWVQEEIAAHNLERKVLNQRTNGGYDQLLAEILSRTSGRSLVRFLARVSPKDILALDGFFTPGIPEETDIRAVQYFFNLGQRWLRERYQGTELSAREVAFYRMFTVPHNTNVR